MAKKALEKHVFCHQCGNRLSSKEIGDEGVLPYCEACNLPFFDTPKPCVFALVVNENNDVALVKQSYVSETHWVLPAGYMTTGENIEEAISREILEETGLTVQKCHYVSSYYKEKKQLLMIGVLAHVTGDLSKSSCEVDDVKWAPLEDVPRFLRPGSTGLEFYYAAKELLES